MKIPIFEITQTFTFDSAHYLSDHKGRPEYARVHGHSFICEVTLGGTRLPGNDWLVDFTTFETALNDVKSILDHQTLNDIPGLETPTMENITVWVTEKLSVWLGKLEKKGQKLLITRVKLMRPTTGQACSYSPSLNELQL
jgi:6-pyruvoyltetrahydropterin/6-carboxytetrahydropterin synthase